MLDLAEDKGLISGRFDVYAFMDYCMAKLGFGKVDRKVPEDLKEYIDTMLEKSGVIEKFKKISGAKT